MKTRLPLCSLALALVATVVSAQNPAADADGFIPLFNGKDLAGWSPAKENPDSFSVKDGILVVKGGRSHLFYTGAVSDHNFTNFELKLKIMTTPNSNSGVYFHTQPQDTGWPDLGYECQVNSTHKDPKKTGSLYGIMNIWAGDPPPAGKPLAGENKYVQAAPSKDGEWFDYNIKVQGKKITIQVNGETTVAYTEPEGGPQAAGFKGRKLSSGTFALQAHDPASETHYKDIKVKPLP